MSKKQTYKIYINDVKVLLISNEEVNQYDIKDKEILFAKYTGKVKQLLNYIDMCEKNPKMSTLIICYENFEELKKDFKSLFTINEAAGGLIKNEWDEFLFIFRRGFWDLPKGKIENNETKKQAALREVIEETNISEVNINSKLCITKHTFRNRLGTRIIKKSHWYTMDTHKQELTPQLSEDIEIAKWLKIEEFLQNYKPVYKNILDVLKEYEKAFQQDANA